MECPVDSPSTSQALFIKCPWSPQILANDLLAPLEHVPWTLPTTPKGDIPKGCSDFSSFRMALCLISYPAHSTHLSEIQLSWRRVSWAARCWSSQLKQQAKIREMETFGKKLGSHPFILITSKDLNKLKKQLFIETNQVARQTANCKVRDTTRWVQKLFIYLSRNPRTKTSERPGNKIRIP